MSDEARRAFVGTLHAKRLALGLSQDAVGKRIGVHGNTVGKWELGRYFPTIESAKVWARMLGVRVVGGELDGLFRPAAGWLPNPPPACGTPAGYRRHKDNNERCPECWAAWSKYICDLRKKRRAGSGL